MSAYGVNDQELWRLAEQDATGYVDVIDNGMLPNVVGIVTNSEDDAGEVLCLGLSPAQNDYDEFIASYADKSFIDPDDETIASAVLC